MRRKLLAAFVALLGLLSLAAPASAQFGVMNMRAYVVAACGTLPQPYIPNNFAPATIDINGNWCNNGGGGGGGSTTANVLGFTAASTATPLPVSTATNTRTFTAGNEVVAQNVGTAGAFCTPGSGPATTSGQYLAPNGGGYSWYNTSGITALSCITAASSTTVNIAAGVGLPVFSGGGSTGGGSGGSVTITSPIGTTALGSAVAVQPATSAIWGIALNATPTIANGNGVVPTQAGAAISAANPTFAAISVGGNVMAVGNPIFVTPGTGAVFAANPGTTAQWGLYAQNAATAGQIGSLLMGAVTSGPPVYANGQTSAISIDTAGNVRVNCVTGCGGGGGGGAITGPLGAQALAASVATNVSGSTLAAGSSASAGLPVQGMAGMYPFSVNCLSGCSGGGGGGGVITGPVGATTAALGLSTTQAGYTAMHISSPLSVTTSSATSSAAASGTFLVAQNVGANGAYCFAGAGPATLSGQYLAPGGGSYAWYNSAGITQISCLTASSTTTVNFSTGDGSPFLTGGGGGGGSGGSVTIAGPLGTQALSASVATNLTGSTLASGSSASAGLPIQGMAGMYPIAATFTTNSGAPLVQASASAAINISSAGTTQIIALSGTTKTYITAIDITSGGSGTVQLEYGTGTNCATLIGTLSGQVPVVANSGFAKGGGIGPVYVVPPGDEVCIVTGSSATAQGSVAYTQF